jgi:hypothetical protein
MPRSKDVGAWVAATAKLILESRAKLVQAVEQASHKMPVAAHSSGPGLARAIEEAERRRENAELPTDVGVKAAAPPLAPVLPPGEEGTALSTVQSTSTEVVAPPVRSRASVALAIGGGVSLVLALGIALALSRSSLVPSRGDAPPAGATLAEPPPSASVAVSPAATSAAPVGVVVTPSATASAKPPSRPAVRQAPPAPKKACEIPYVIDAKGQKHFKPECVDN